LRVKVKYHEVPDPQQSIRVKEVTVQASHLVMDKGLYTETELIKFLSNVREVDLEDGLEAGQLEPEQAL